MNDDLKLRWRVTARHSLYQWYGHVRVFDGWVVGQWICVDLGSGDCIWERKLGRPNTVVGIGEGVIVATELRSDGPSTMAFGVYGVDFKTGALVWKSHRDGLFGRICNALDAIPGLTNEIRDAPSSVEAGEVRCRSGRVLDVRNGRCLRREPLERPGKVQIIDVATAARKGTSIDTVAGELEILAASPEHHHRFIVTLQRSRETIWRIDVADHGRFVGGGGRSWRRLGGRLLVLTSVEPPTVPIEPERPSVVRRNPTHYELWIIDIRSGALLQKVPVNDAPAFECRIENADSDHILVSTDNKHLACYRMQSNPSPAPSEPAAAALHSSAP